MRGPGRRTRALGCTYSPHSEQLRRHSLELVTVVLQLCKPPANQKESHTHDYHCGLNFFTALPFGIYSNAVKYNALNYNKISRTQACKKTAIVLDASLKKWATLNEFNFLSSLTTVKEWSLIQKLQSLAYWYISCLIGLQAVLAAHNNPLLSDFTLPLPFWPPPIQKHKCTLFIINSLVLLRKHGYNHDPQGLEWDWHAFSKSSPRLLFPGDRGGLQSPLSPTPHSRRGGPIISPPSCAGYTWIWQDRSYNV